MYKRQVESLLGRTVIVDDMDTAINLAKQNSYSFRIVTLKGDVINPSGAIQGGSVQTKTVNILGRSKEIEELKNNINLLDEKVKALQEDKVKYQESVSSVIEKAKEFEKISIVISAYNEEETIEEVLLSLRNLNYPSLEIFIVDDKSSDRTLEKLYEVKKSFDDWETLTILEQKENKGKATALNVALQQVNSKYMLCLLYTSPSPRD